MLSLNLRHIIISLYQTIYSNNSNKFRAHYLLDSFCELPTIWTISFKYDSHTYRTHVCPIYSSPIIELNQRDYAETNNDNLIHSNIRTYYSR